MLQKWLEITSKFYLIKQIPLIIKEIKIYRLISLSKSLVKLKSNKLNNKLSLVKSKYISNVFNTCPDAFIFFIANDGNSCDIYLNRVINCIYSISWWLNISAYNHFCTFSELLKRSSPEIFHGERVSKSTTSQFPDVGYVPEAVSYLIKPAF